MKKKVLVIFLLSCFTCFSQEDAWLYFRTKNGYDTYIKNPLLMLSNRALERRAVQKIPLDYIDVPIDKAYVDQIKAVAGIKVLAKSKWMNALHIQGEQHIIRSLSSLPFVEKLEFANNALNLTGKGNGSNRIKEVQKSLDLKADYPYGNSANQINIHRGEELHKANYSGSGKIIAVLDAGFLGVNTTEPFARLRNENKILGGYDFVHRSVDFYTGDAHGTQVLSTMGAYKENELIGTAVDASYYLFITENALSEKPEEESYWVEAAERADSLGVDIINSSLGYFEYDKPSYSHTYAQMDGKTAFISRGAEIAFSRGMIVVVAAGNEGNTENFHIAAPADAVSVLSVGAVSPTGIILGFSSRGPTIDQRIKPEIVAQGQGVVVANAAGAIVNGNGTSFASPISCGLVACLWQAFPTKTNKEIRDMIIRSSDRYTQADNNYGYGIPDFALALGVESLRQRPSLPEVIVYPNPTSDVCSFRLPSVVNQATIRIYSMLGQKIQEQQISSESSTLSLKELEAGAYIYELEVAGTRSSGKLIKQ